LFSPGKGLLFGHRLQSSSASHFTAVAFGFFYFLKAQVCAAGHIFSDGSVFDWFGAFLRAGMRASRLMHCREHVIPAQTDHTKR
jgi:hypothetical protein